MTDFLYDMYQSRQIAAASAEAANANDRVSRTNDEIAHLKKRIDKMVLVNCAMWELLKEKTDVTDIELKAKILEVDAADGAIDGKMGTATRYCTNCGKTMHPKHANCLYCGKDNKPINVHAGI